MSMYRRNNEKILKCGCINCIHKNVCSHMTEMKELLNKIKEIDAIKDKDSIFSINVICHHHMSLYNEDNIYRAPSENVMLCSDSFTNNDRCVDFSHSYSIDTK